jgi:hypothetical protein
MNCLRGTCPSTAEHYCQQLRHLKESIQQKRQGERYGVILQHDNAQPHTANITKPAIQEPDWEIPPHLPNSQDLAPSDYHIIHSLSNNLWDFFRRGIDNLLERWEAVMNNGEYIID